ncbi:MAG: HAMP domain-containing protein [Hyphomicrobiales bacterium]|nr:MAG: HAMP domain-containing protein [Hyphomicrobiales bacterium]
MLRRLGFTGRLMAIVMLALIALWAVGVGWLFVRESRESLQSRLYPLPEQAAAIVDLIDATEPGNRALVLKSVTSERLIVSVTPTRPELDAGADRLPLIERFLSQYLHVMAPREVIAVTDRSARNWLVDMRLGEYWLNARQPLRFAVSLRTGGYVVFEARELIGRRLFGWPPGFGVGVLGALIGIAAILAIAREARPLRELSQSVGRFTGETANEVVKVSGAPEIRTLILAINGMQSRISEMVRGRTLLLGAISHDLKTYITRLRLRVEQLPDEVQREKAAKDLDDMTELLENALAVARGSMVSSQRQQLDLGVLLKELAADYNAAGTPISENLGTQPAVLIDGEPVALRRLFTNLIDNALQFGHRVELDMHSARAPVVVTIDDDGPGIPEEAHASAFLPFYRLEESRNRATGGTGLGLAIVKQIATAHGGDVALSTSPLGGLRVTVTLPLAAEQ